MRCPIILVLFLDLAARAVATKCDAGYKHKADLNGLYCSSAATDAASCSNNCCKKDDTKCGGLPVICGPDKYHDTTDAWKKTAATTKTWKTVCCKEKATCGGSTYDCPAGKQKEFTTFSSPSEKRWHAKKCSGGPSSCAETCCIGNTDLCGATPCTGGVCTGGNSLARITSACTAGGTDYYMPKTDDAWKNAPILPATQRADPAHNQKACCGIRAKCGSKLYSCPAGQKKRNPTTQCTKGPDSCARSPDVATCCELDDKTCGGNSVACAGSNQYNPTHDSWKKKATTTATAAVDCCTTRATCKDAVCNAGYKKRANVDSISCPTNRESCSASTGPCCEKDTNTCGGVTGISCAYGTFDESTTWTTKTTKAVKDAWKAKNTTAATKNTNCCTPSAVCVYEAPGTTTPSAVVTTTPAAPVRRYSEHVLAVKKASDQPHGGNLVWVAVGGFLGMGVLMGVQGLRSRTPAACTSLE